MTKGLEPESSVNVYSVTASVEMSVYLRYLNDLTSGSQENQFSSVLIY